MDYSSAQAAEGPPSTRTAFYKQELVLPLLPPAAVLGARSDVSKAPVLLLR